MSVLNLDKKFIWIWVPKNAGSSIYHKLRRHDLDAGSEGNHRPFTEMITEATSQNLNPDEYFKWAFARDPYTRIASAYFHLIHAHYFHVYDNFDDFLLNDFRGKEGDLSIENSKMKTHSSSRSVIHFKTQTSFLQSPDGTINFDFIGRVENIDKDWDIVCDAVGVPKDNLQIFNSKVEGTSFEHPVDPPPPARAHITDYSKHFGGPAHRAKIEIVNELYKEDFENFRYKML